MNDPAVADARAWGRAANERAARYRAALVALREHLPPGSPGHALISAALAPESAPRLWINVPERDHRLTYHALHGCALDGSDPVLASPEVARLLARPCPRCAS